MQSARIAYRDFPCQRSTARHQTMASPTTIYIMHSRKQLHETNVEPQSDIDGEGGGLDAGHPVRYARGADGVEESLTVAIRDGRRCSSSFVGVREVAIDRCAPIHRRREVQDRGRTEQFQRPRVRTGPSPDAGVSMAVLC